MARCAILSMSDTGFLLEAVIFGNFSRKTSVVLQKYPYYEIREGSQFPWQAQGANTMPYNVVMMALGVTAALSFILTLVAWRQRSTSSSSVAGALAGLLLAVTWWTVLYTFEVGLTALGVKNLASQAKFLGVVTVPVAWFVFAAFYTGRATWVTRRSLVSLGILPALTTAFIWTNDAHHLMWASRDLATAGGVSVIRSIPAIWFWIHSAYSYVLIMAGSYLLFRQFIGSPALYRRQLSALFVGVMVPLIGNAITIFGSAIVDLTPFAFAITGLSFTWGLLRYQLLDIAPVARDAVIDSMTDGMLVLDVEERVVDINPSAQALIGRTGIGGDRAAGHRGDTCLVPPSEN